MGTQDPDGVAEFAADLRALRIAAGEPPYRELARKSGYSRATVHEALAGRRMPSLEVTLAVVGTLGGDAVRWRSRWVAARTAADPGGAAAAWTGPPVTASTGPPVTASGAGVPAGPGVPAGSGVSADAGVSAAGGSGRGRRPWLVAAVVLAGLVVLLAGGLVFRPDHAPAPDSSAGPAGCRTMARYRLTDDGNLLAPAADARIGTVRRGDLVDLLARSDAAHPHRFVVLVESTGQVGTVDTAKLAAAGSACVTASR